MGVTPDFKDQEGVPLQLLDIFIYTHDRSLNLWKGVVLGFTGTTGGGWIKYRNLSDLENIDSSIRRKPNDVYYWGHRVDNIWVLSDLVNKKRPANLVKIGRWQPIKETVEQIQCPELVDIILNNL